MSRAVHSIQIIGSKRSGGAERFFLRLTAALARRGRTTIAVTPPSSELVAALPPDLERVAIPMRGIWDLLSRRAIARLVAERRPAIVQTWMGRATRLTHLPSGSPTVHFARLGGFYNPKGYRHADVLVGNTRGICRYLVEQGFDADRVHHVGNFVDPPLAGDAEDRERCRAEINVASHTPLVLFTGRLHDNKGVPDLLAAFEEVARHVPAAHLAVVGDGPLRESVERRIAVHPARHRIHLTGWRDDVGRFYAAADLFVCPSRHEPLGNVVLEAWSHGLPVVATRSAGPSELVTDGEDGVLVPIAAPQALAGAIVRVLRDRALGDRLAAAGRETVAARHSEQAVVDAYLALFDRFVEPR